MRPERKLIIDSLGAVVAEKRMRMQSLGMMNANTDEVSRMRLSIDYAQAQADLHTAEAALRAAIKGEQSER
jgi:hypothetical protein